MSACSRVNRKGKYGVTTVRTRAPVPHQLRFIQHAIYTNDFPPQEVPHTLIVKMELQVLMASKAWSQHLLWVSQILIHSSPLICSVCPASSLQIP